MATDFDTYSTKISNRLSELQDFLVHSDNTFLNRILGDYPDINAFISIGCCPSSGSTFFAKLLDSVPEFLCDPELGYLTFAETFNDFQSIKDDISFNHRYLPLCGYNKPRTIFNLSQLNSLDISIYDLQYILVRSDSIYSFMNYYSKFRSYLESRSIHYYCEKTPGNVNTFDYFSQGHSSAFPVAIVRDGYDVINSLVRRGYSVYQALMIFLYQTNTLLSLTGSVKPKVVHYEDLILNPFSFIRNFIKNLLDLNISEIDIENNFFSKSSSHTVSGISSWSLSPTSVYSTAEMKTSRKTVLTDDDIKYINRAFLYDSNRQVSILSFQDAQSHFGYSLQSHQDDPAPMYLESIIHGDNNLDKSKLLHGYNGFDILFSGFPAS